MKSKLNAQVKVFKSCLCVSLMLTIYATPAVSFAQAQCNLLFEDEMTPANYAKHALDNRKVLAITMQGETNYYPPKEFLDQMNRAFGFRANLANWKLVDLEQYRTELINNWEQKRTWSENRLQSLINKFNDNKQWDITDSEWQNYPKDDSVVKLLKDYSPIIRQAMGQSKLLRMYGNTLTPRELVEIIVKKTSNPAPLLSIQLVDRETVLNEERQRQLEVTRSFQDELQKLEKEYGP